MRVTISHNKGRQEATRLVNEQADQLFNSVAAGPVQVVDKHKAWSDNVMDFGFKAKMGFFSVPITGKVECTDSEVIIEADLPPLLTRMIPEEKIKSGIEGRVRGMLGPAPPAKA